MKRLTTFLMALLLTWIGANAQSSWTAPQLTASSLTSGESYYLYNVGAGEFLVNGNNYLTRASVGPQGLVTTVTSTNSGWTIMFASVVGSYVNKTNCYLYYIGEALYCDQDAVSEDSYFTITEVSGQTDTYTIVSTNSAASSTYVGWDENDDTVVSPMIASVNENTYWQFIAASDYELYFAQLDLYDALVEAEGLGMTDSNDAYKEAGNVYNSSSSTVDEINAAIEALEEAMEGLASADNPVDVTSHYIVNPDFDTSDLEGWSDTFGFQSASYTNADADVIISGFAESWSSTTLADKTFSQTLTLPKGTYRLEADAIAVLQSNATLTVSGVFLYAGIQETSIHTGNGLPEHYAVDFYVAEDEGTVDVGIKISGTDANWVGVDNFRLYYRGEAYSLSGDEAHDCVAEFNHWSITDHNTGLFQRNTWSTEEDPSGMVTPFIEYWIGSGYVLEDATISHETIYGEPGETYKVSIDYRTFIENSDEQVSQGSSFNANSTSADLCLGTRGVYDGASQEEYAIGYTILCQADATTGAIDVKFEIKDADFDWIAFKNLNVTKFDAETDEWPTLTAVEGDMNSAYASAQADAIAAYNETPSYTTYLAAFNAVSDAQLSALFYSDIAATLEELNLDEAGQAAFSASANGAAYAAKTLDYCDMTSTYINAEASQAVGTELKYTENNAKWICEQGNGPTYMNPGYETYTSGAYTAGKVMYQLLGNLPEGYTYEIQFYAFARSQNGGGNSVTGTSTAQAYANDEKQEMTVELNGSTGIQSEGYLHTFTVTVGADGLLEYGIENIAAGGNWYMADLKSITIAEPISESVAWEMTDAGWGTMILPFAADIPTVTDEDEEATLTLYAGSALSLEGTTITVSDAEAAETIEANVPYLVKGTAGTYTFTGTPVEATTLTSGMLTGTLVDMTYSDFTADGTEYVLQDHEDEGLAFYPITDESEGVTLDAYHCYLNTGAVVSALRLPGMATAIEAVEGDVIANDAIYDLSGRRVSKAVKGVYIQNGKKVLVK